MAMPLETDYRRALSWAEQYCRFESDGFIGFDFNCEHIDPDPESDSVVKPDGVWFEGTAQMALAYKINNEFDQAEFYLSELRRAQLEATNANGKGIVAASHDGVTTGFSWEYFSRLHIGATAWYILAEQGFNPYWGTFSIPDDNIPPTNLTGSNFINNGAVTTESPLLELSLSSQDNNGVAAYFIAMNQTGEAPNAPLLTDSGWYLINETTNLSRQISYLSQEIENDKSVHVCVWFADASGNLSQVAYDDIHYLDEVKPENTTANDFLNSVSFASGLHSITFNISANDNGGIVDYYIADNTSGIAPDTPSADAAGWINVDFTTAYDMATTHALSMAYPQGTRVYVYIWFKDAAGNVSQVVMDSLILRIFYEDWENGLGNWTTDNDVWQIGLPTSGPSSCKNGNSCAGTILSSSYPPHDDSRLISIPISLPQIIAPERLSLQFWQWFSYSSHDAGTVQISVQKDGVWSDWVNLGNSQVNVSDWSFMAIDLSAYSGQTVRIAFYHSAGRDQYGRGSESHGWFVDEVKIVSGTPQFSGDFESGWGDWSADRGVWQVGTPGASPAACYAGSSCVGTTLNGVYPVNTDSRLISAPLEVSGVQPRLTFWQWFSYSSHDVLNI